MTPPSSPWDPVLFSGAIPAWVAMALCAAAGQAFGSPTPLPLVLLAGAGTLVVYNVDRLRDLHRDHTTSPLRTAFVSRHRSALTAITGISLVLAFALALSMPRSVWILCGAVGALGLLHRRLKSISGVKTLYVTLSWVAVTVGLPALVAPRVPGPSSLAAISLAFGGAIAANLMVSNLRDGENLAGRFGRTPVLRLARGTCTLAIAAAVLGPGTSALALVPIAELIALARLRPGERYAVAVVDGALAAGAVAAIALLPVL